MEKLISIEYNTEEKRSIILTNVIKMLTARKILDKKKLDANIDKILKFQTDDLTYKIKSDVDEKQEFVIKFFLQKISSVSKTTGIIEFLNAHKNSPKILIVTNINPKAQKKLTTDFYHVEVFKDIELMINLIEHELIPKHELLTEDEKKEFLKSYQCKKKNLMRMYLSDPVARYYKMEVGDIVRIMRPSETSGYSLNYRIIINK
jgi:DNA-directed RNA polymerase I, II, and III subunit RPABC1